MKQLISSQPPFILDGRLLPEPTLDFVLPAHLEAGEPPEARGLARDEVRLMVSTRSDDRVVHTQFRQIDEFLEAGDLLVINTSGTMPAALEARRADGTLLELHLSTRLPAGLWSVELRIRAGKATRPFYDVQSGETLRLPAGASATLHLPHRRTQFGQVEAMDEQADQHRLWLASLQLSGALHPYMQRYGFPIRYDYVRDPWPLSYYQSVFATEMGSAEMPSAGRAFTQELLARLVARGIVIAPLLLHTGVASLEAHEPPYEEYYRVPASTARLVNMTRAAGGRVIAVGTTVIRSLETVTDQQGVTHPGEGWTSLVVTPQRGLRAVNALLTGLHEPRASHLLMLEALASQEHLRLAYDEALKQGYLWHEFGDLHLILP
ncbi:MAG: S-adenosylmethionine:tRNA ribosyltransferase-isomerase [Ktedonobacteraceae bacterium]|nr:S-adenosylmethionine:tRNA ribosyltransferase-isomerase [Ktedonobacteraceae bacterium]